MTFLSCTPLKQTEREALRVLRDAVSKAADKHRRMGVPMAVWQNGRAVLVTPAPTGRPRQARRKP